MEYALKRWPGFTCFLDDGRIEIDNKRRRAGNPPSGSPKKNALFTGHQLGVENWAAIASLVETCKLQGLNPYASLAGVLARVITRAYTDPIDDLLPYNWVDTSAGQTVFETTDIARAA